MVPGVEGNDEGAAEAASDSTGITPSTVNEGVIDAVVDDSVVKGDIEAETSPEGPAEGASNVRPDGEGEHQLRVNSEDEDRSSFGSVSKTPIRPHASGGTRTRGDEELVPSVVVVVEEEEDRRVGRGESGCESRVHRLRRQLVFDSIRRG